MRSTHLRPFDVESSPSGSSISSSGASWLVSCSSRRDSSSLSLETLAYDANKVSDRVRNELVLAKALSHFRGGLATRGFALRRAFVRGRTEHDGQKVKETMMQRRRGSLSADRSAIIDLSTAGVTVASQSTRRSFSGAQAARTSAQPLLGLRPISAIF